MNLVGIILLCAKLQSRDFHFSQKTYLILLLCYVEDLDILPEESDPKYQGLEPFDAMMPTLGLADRRPIPEPVTFGETDPLGANIITSNSNNHDIVTSISE